jgi:hypothetical protein
MYSRLYSPTYNQTGTQSSKNEPARISPVLKLFQARNASPSRIRPLQKISNVFMPPMYNKTALVSMGILPDEIEESPNGIKKGFRDRFGNICRNYVPKSTS